MHDETIETVPEPVTEALQVREAPVLSVDRPTTQKTPQEMRVVEVSEALLPAYQKASTLELTDQEVESLMAPFPDTVVEVRPHDGLLYIPHIHVSNRLNRIFRPGKWALVRRREWFDGDSNTMYGEYVLMIRGCYVGESVGGHPFAKSNPKINYSDVLESTAAEALRRIAGKRLSCGSQVWDPDYCRQWEAKWRGCANGKYYKKNHTPATTNSTTPPAAPAPKPQPKPESPKYATAATRTWMIKQLTDYRELAGEYFRAISQLLPNEEIEDLPLEYVPINHAQLDALKAKLTAFSDGDPAERAFPPNPQPLATKPSEPPAGDAPDEPWRAFPMPFGKHAGTALCDLDKKYLFGLWANYVVETEYNGKPKRPETIEKDRLFREMLDAAGRHYQFEKKD